MRLTDIADGLRQGAIKAGVIPDGALNFFGDRSYARAYRQTLDELSAGGIELVEIDYRPFDEAARLLYEGPWVSKRYLAIQTLITKQPEALLPVIRAIIEPGGSASAVDLFKAQYRLEYLKQQCLAQLRPLDCILTPTAGRLFTVEEMQAEPLKRNSELGYYTNFMNLLDLAAVAVPTVFTGQELPFGITLAGPAFSDRALLSIAKLHFPCGKAQQHTFCNTAPWIQGSIIKKYTIESTGSYFRDPQVFPWPDYTGITQVRTTNKKIAPSYCSGPRKKIAC
jgi:allophanate hydrolase